MRNSEEMQSVYSYPSWYWRFGYLVGTALFVMAVFFVFHYLVTPDVKLKGLIGLLLLWIPLVIFIFYISQKYKKLYSNIVVGKDGISGPVIQSPNSFKRIRVNTFISWGNILAVERFSGTDLDALRIGPTASGIRILVKDGRILILDRIPGFQEIVEKIEQATGRRVHYVM